MEIDRDYYLNKLISHIGSSMVKVITGVRRCGKSYLLFKIFKNYLTFTGTKEKNIISIALDDIDYASLKNPLNLSEYIKEKIQNPCEKYFILIDEI